MAGPDIFRFHGLMNRTFFITATDTGVGKTVFTTLLAAFLSQRGTRVAAFKPVCSGGRGDARQLQAALGGAMALETINPWYFRAAIAPLLAARRENQAVRLAQVLAHVRTARRGFDVTLVEGAGGLLSPLGEDFDSRDLMTELHATPIIVAPNQLGVVNQIVLTLEALPKGLRAGAMVILMGRPKRDSATHSNAALLEELKVRQVHRLPWLGRKVALSRSLEKTEVKRVLAAVAGEALAGRLGKGQTGRGARAE